MCLLSHISPMERLFVLKTLSRTQRATKVKKYVGFSLKPLRCRDPALPPLYGHAYSRPFFSCTRMRIYRVYTRMIHRRGFSTLVLFILYCISCDDTVIMMMQSAHARVYLSAMSCPASVRVGWRGLRAVRPLCRRLHDSAALCSPALPKERSGTHF